MQVSLWNSVVLPFCALAFLLPGLHVAAVEQSAPAQAVPLREELGRLEGLKARGKIGGPELTRLAEIYYLTSRCGDIGALEKFAGWAQTVSEKERQAVRRELAFLTCACGEKCGREFGDLSQLGELRGLLEKHGAHWRDARVQKLWKTVEQSPEARYWALKWLTQKHDYNDVGIRKIRLELEQSLHSLEVN